MKNNLLKGCITSIFIATSTLANAGIIPVEETITIYESENRGDEQDFFIWSFDDLTEEISEINLTFDWERMDFNDKFDTQDDFQFYEQFSIYSGDSYIGLVGKYTGFVGEYNIDNPPCEVIPERTESDGTYIKSWESNCSGSISFTLTDSALWANDVLTLTAVSNSFYKTKIDGVTQYSTSSINSDSVLTYGVQSSGDFTEDNQAGYVRATIGYTYDDTTSPNKVPEPSSLGMIVLGLMGLVVRKVKKNS